MYENENPTSANTSKAVDAVSTHHQVTDRRATVSPERVGVPRNHSCCTPPSNSPAISGTHKSRRGEPARTVTVTAKMFMVSPVTARKFGHVISHWECGGNG